MLSMALPALGFESDAISKMSCSGSGWSPDQRPKATRSAVSPALPPMFFRYQSRAEEISGTFRCMESNGGASYDVWPSRRAENQTAIAAPHAVRKPKRIALLDLRSQ